MKQITKRNNKHRQAISQIWRRQIDEGCLCYPQSARGSHAQSQLTPLVPWVSHWSIEAVHLWRQTSPQALCQLRSTICKSPPLHSLIRLKEGFWDPEVTIPLDPPSTSVEILFSHETRLFSLVTTMRADLQLRWRVWWLAWRRHLPPTLWGDDC